MKITNSTSFLIPPLSLDSLIKKRSSRSIFFSYNIPLSFPKKKESGYYYILNYNTLLKIVTQNIIKQPDFRGLFGTNFSDIFWSLFSNSSFLDANLLSLRVLIAHNSTEKVNMISHTSRTIDQLNTELLLNFDFWCSSPVSLSFINILIHAKEPIEKILFNTTIIHCDEFLYKSIAYRETYIISKTEKSVMIMCFKNKIIQDFVVNIKNYSRNYPITCELNTPHIFDPKQCIVKIWGEHNYIPELKFRSKSKYFCYNSSIDVTEYFCTDKEKIDDYEWVTLTNIEYKLPFELLNKYIDICNYLAEQKMLWILQESGQEEKSLQENGKKSILTNTEIQNLELKYTEELENNINKLTSNGDISIENYKLPTFSPEIIKVDVVISLFNHHRIFIFYNNKTVNEYHMTRPDILKAYNKFLDIPTKQALDDKMIITI